MVTVAFLSLIATSLSFDNNSRLIDGKLGLSRATVTQTSLYSASHRQPYSLVIIDHAIYPLCVKTSLLTAPITPAPNIRIR